MMAAKTNDRSAGDIFLLMHKHLLFLLLLWVAIASCEKTETPSQAEMAPSNLVITETVSTDGSGLVDFKATANNATSYKFEFGNGEIKEVPSGIISYKYTALGSLTYTVKVTATNQSGKFTTASKNITVTVSAGSMSLVWSDEFNNTGLPISTHWAYEIGTGNGGWGNNELQYYTNRLQNAYCENGVLKIKAIKEAFSGSQYTSARLLTRGKFEFKYGRVEVKAKLPTGVGTWPAIWMLGTNITTVGWPACGEIDIMEHRGSEPNKIHSSLHYPGRSGGNPVTNTRVISNATTEFHLYRADWTSSSIDFYIDDLLFFKVPNSASIPFNHNFYILINIAMGGTFGGAIASNFTNAEMEIDYIRVYQ